MDVFHVIFWMVCIQCELQKIENLMKYQQMIEIASILSKPFPHVRVDLVETTKGLKAAELTFYTGSGFHPWSPMEYDKIFGALLSHSLHAFDNRLIFRGVLGLGAINNSVKSRFSNKINRNFRRISHKERTTW